MKNTILALLLLTTIACEKESGESTESKATTDQETTKTVDISPEFDGNYNTLCIADSNLEFGAGKITRLELNSGDPMMIVTEYGEAGCITPVVIRSYSLVYSVESVESLEETVITTSIEYVQSNLEILHSTYNGYNACGFTAGLNVEYPLNSPCLTNLSGSEESYVVEISDLNYKLSGGGQVIDFTKE